MDTSTHHHALEPALLRAGRAAAGPSSAPGRRGGGIATGRLGEWLAARHLGVDDGLEVVARNWRLARGELRGELDVVAVDHARGMVVVCEVKTRTSAAYFDGAVGALAPRQRTRIRALTAAFLREARLPYGRVRLDLVAIDLGTRARLTHLEGVL